MRGRSCIGGCFLSSYRRSGSLRESLRGGLSWCTCLGRCLRTSCGGSLNGGDCGGPRGRLTGRRGRGLTCCRCGCFTWRNRRCNGKGLSSSSSRSCSEISGSGLTGGS